MDQRATATFVVLTGGQLGSLIARLAEEHAALDPERRRVANLGDAAYPSDNKTALRPEESDTVALVLRQDGSLSDLLDANRAVSEAWIENAYLRATLNLSAEKLLSD